MSNGHERAVSASVVRALDKLELQVKALSLHEHDVILVQFSSQPRTDEVLDLQRNMMHMLSHLKLEFKVFFLIVPPGISLAQLDEAELNRMGYFRKEIDDEQAQ